MTVATLAAIALGEQLARQKTSKSLTPFAHHFQKNIPRIIAAPWLLATSSDRLWQARLQQRKAPRTARLLHWYKQQIFRGAVRDAKIYSEFLAVVNMIKKPIHLFHPRLILRMIVAALFSKRPLMKRQIKYQQTVPE